MIRRLLILNLAVAAMILFLPQSNLRAAAQDKPQTLGSVRIPKAVKANGQSLAAGTYTLRLTTESPSPVVGQTPAESRWVEFVQGGQVKGREVATVLSAAELKQVAEDKPPASGSAKGQMLKGNDYFRIWINHAGTHYLVHLAVE